MTETHAEPPQSDMQEPATVVWAPGDRRLMAPLMSAYLDSYKLRMGGDVGVSVVSPSATAGIPCVSRTLRRKIQRQGHHNRSPTLVAYGVGRPGQGSSRLLNTAQEWKGTIEGTGTSSSLGGSSFLNRTLGHIDLDILPPITAPVKSQSDRDTDKMANKRYIRIITVEISLSGIKYNWFKGPFGHLSEAPRGNVLRWSRHKI